MITSPVLIIGCPRSGTTLLYNILSEVSTLWSIGYESKAIIERFHHPARKGWESGVLTAADLTTESARAIRADFERGAASGIFWRRVNVLRGWLAGNAAWRAIKRRGRASQAGSAVSSALPQGGLDTLRALVRLGNSFPFRRQRAIRLLEKTPENCLRLEFLQALFHDARVIYLTRDGRSNIHSLMEGWRQPHLFAGYDVPEEVSIPGDERGRWAFTLIPGWRELLASPLEVVCARQWIACNEAVLAHRAAGGLPYLTIRHEELTSSPAEVLSRVAQFVGFDFESEIGRYGRVLPSVNVVSRPSAEKWRGRDRARIESVLPLIEPTMRRLGYESNSS
jgi:hypothetical protein